MDKGFRLIGWIGTLFVLIGSLLIAQEFSFKLGIAIWLIATGIEASIFAFMSRMGLVFAEEMDKQS